MLKDKLLSYLKSDTDFNKYSSILEEVVNLVVVDIGFYLLDKKYLDVSYVVIDDLIIDLDTIYYLCVGWYD